MQPYQGQLPTPIQRARILPAQRVQPIQTAYGQRLEQRYAMMPAELKREVQFYHAQRNRQLLKQILDSIAYNIRYYPNGDVNRDAEHLQNEYRRLAQQHGIQTRLDFDFQSRDDGFGGFIRSVTPRIQLQEELVTDAFIYDLLRLVVAYNRRLNLNTFIDRLNYNLSQARSPFRILKQQRGVLNPRYEIIRI